MEESEGEAMLTPKNQMHAANGVSSAIEKMQSLVVALETELNRRETSQGKSHDVRKMTALREKIASVQRRLERAMDLRERM